MAHDVAADGSRGGRRLRAHRPVQRCREGFAAHSDLRAVGRAREPARQCAARHGAAQGRPRGDPRLQLYRVGGDLRRPRQGRADRSAGQLPPGRHGGSLHRTGRRRACVHRPGRAARQRRGSPRRARYSRCELRALRNAAGAGRVSPIRGAARAGRGRRASRDRHPAGHLGANVHVRHHGNSKGAIRSHAGQALMALVTTLDFGFSRDDAGLLVMPMCHANSLNFFSAFAYCGAACGVYDRHSFDPEHLLATLSAQHVSFTSLVPTHYIMTLGLPQAVKDKYDVGSVNKLLISSAPARRETKLAIMEHFRNSRLYELYGSTEAGWVTLLRPDHQLTKLGSVGREFTGTGRVRLLDEAGNDVPEGEVGELYSRTPYTFDGYWNLPDKTAEAFRGAYCSVGDMARRDADGFYHLVDRKKNMIISGGENVYPSEVENLLARHPAVKDVAVVGVPHEKWGEAVHAVVMLNAGRRASEADLLEWCKDKIAGYKRPRSISFMREEDVPRTATGKIQHRLLRDRIVKSLTKT